MVFVCRWQWHANRPATNSMPSTKKRIQPPNERNFWYIYNKEFCLILFIWRRWKVHFLLLLLQLSNIHKAMHIFTGWLHYSASNWIRFYSHFLEEKKIVFEGLWNGNEMVEVKCWKSNLISKLGMKKRNDKNKIATKDFISSFSHFGRMNRISFEEIAIPHSIDTTNGRKKKQRRIFQ